MCDGVEIERLRNTIASMADTRGQLDREIEHLQEALRATHDDDYVEFLQGEAADWQRKHDEVRAHDAQMTTQVVNSKAELERLRETVKTAFSDTIAAEQATEQFRTKVERLRGQLEWYEDHFARLRRIEETAKEADFSARSTPHRLPTAQSLLALRAALEEEA